MYTERVPGYSGGLTKSLSKNIIWVFHFTVDLCYTKQVWRRTEVAVTGLTRNQFTGLTPVRGFESLRLRDIRTIILMPQISKLSSLFLAV